MLALAQLSRAVEQVKPSIPRLSHLRDSGSIEQDADVVLFIYRKTADKNYRAEEIPPEEQAITEIHIAKHRNGPTGMVRLYFEKKRASFKNLERRFSPKSLPADATGFAPFAQPPASQIPPPPIDPNVNQSKKKIEPPPLGAVS